MGIRSIQNAYHQGYSFHQHHAINAGVCGSIVAHSDEKQSVDKHARHVTQLFCIVFMHKRYMCAMCVHQSPDCNICSCYFPCEKTPRSHVLNPVYRTSDCNK